MSSRRFIIHGGDYDRTRGIGGIYEGIALAYAPRSTREIFTRMLESRCFEVCEFSLANYITLRATGQDWLKAIAVFPSRAFRHGLAVTRRDSALHSLAQLSGKRIGLEDYSMTAAVWFRGMLEDEYGVDLGSITWVTHTRQRFALPPGAKVETTAAPLEELLLEGSIDAMLAFTLQDAKLQHDEQRLRTVVADVQSEARAYYGRTSIYPIMHCVVIRSDALAGEPRLADAVYAAYESAKAEAPVDEGREQRFERTGNAAFTYGLTEQNRRVVERLARYLEQQGFIGTSPAIDALFVGPRER